MKSNSKKTASLFIGLTILTFVTLGLFYSATNGPISPSLDKYPVRGIDVSHHLKEIDWKRVKSQNIQFAFIKATEGGDFKDRRFLANWKAANAAGLDVGAYHFFTFCRTGSEQAENFSETVPVSESALPAVIDLEFVGNCALKHPDESVVLEIDTLQRLLSEKYKRKPIFYTTKEFYDRFLANSFPDNPIWFRDLTQEPSLIDNKEWTFWQYSNKGQLEGINANVDLNVFNGTKKAYKKFKHSAL